jgi:hypothetical protein
VTAEHDTSPERTGWLSSIRDRLRYGASPTHLVAHLAALALAGWALVQIAGIRGADRVVLWLVAGVILHDLVLVPAYSALDGLVRRAAGVRAVNHIRIPAGLSLILLLVYVPVISGKSDPVFRRVSGDELDGYLVRWLVVSAALFAASGALYLLRSRGART